MTVAKRVAINTATKWVSTLVTALLGIVIVTFLVRRLGQAGYGVTVLVTSIIAFSGFLDFGLRNALGRKLADAGARSNLTDLRQIASTAHFMYLFLGAVAGIIVACFAAGLGHIFRIPDELWMQGTRLIRFYASAMILLTFVNASYAARHISQNRYDILNAIAAISMIVRTVLLFLLVGLGSLDLGGWAIAMISAQFLHTAALAVMSRRFYPQLGAAISAYTPKVVRSLFLLGSKLFALQATSLLSVKADPLIISSVLGAPATALYEPAVRLRSAAQPFVNALSGQLYPLTTAFHATDDRRRLQAVLIRGTRYTFLLGSAVCVVLGVFSRPIADIWLGGVLGEGSAQVARVLAVWAAVDLFTYAAGTQWAVLLGMNRLRFLIWTQIPLAILNVAASYLLVSFTSLGVVAVVIPTAVIGAVRRPIIVAHTAHACGLSGRKYFHAAYVRPILALGMTLSAALALQFALDPDTLGSLAGCVLVTGLVWAGATWAIGLTSAERAQIRQKLRSIWHAMARRGGSS